MDDLDAAIGAGSSKWTLSSNVITPNNIQDRVGIGTTTVGDVSSSLYLTHDLASGATGKSLAVFNQTEDQDIFAASSSGVARFVLPITGT